MQPVTVGIQLKSLADFLQRIYACVDLGQIARAIRFHVRDGLLVETRSMGQLDSVEHRMLLALEDVYLASLHPLGPQEGMNPSLAERISTAESYYAEQLETAARMMDRAGLVSSDGAILRAAAPAIAEAAQNIARRRSNDYALDVARDLEKLGAAPSMLFALDGRAVWVNHALTELTESRGLNRTQVIQAACRFAAPLCAALRCRKEPQTRADLRRRVNDLGVHLRGTVLRRNDNVGEALLLIELSEAKRATRLSARELQVALLVSQQHSYKQAAEIAQVSLDSVRTYVRRIYRKFGVSSRIQLKGRLIREGLMKE
jgi:DNA-binding CsgD family transcriptional regulator